jgi:hypothetical protein
MLVNGQHEGIIPRITLVILASLHVHTESITALYPHEPLAVSKERLMTSQGARLVKRAENGPRIRREEFDRVVRASILETVQMIGDDYLDLFLSLIQRRTGTKTLDSANLQDVEFAIDSLFGRFAISIKHVIVYCACTALRIEPEKPLKSLEWTIQELRSSCW